MHMYVTASNATPLRGDMTHTHYIYQARLSPWLEQAVERMVAAASIRSGNTRKVSLVSKAQVFRIYECPYMCLYVCLYMGPYTCPYIRVLIYVLIRVLLRVLICFFMCVPIRVLICVLICALICVLIRVLICVPICVLICALTRVHIVYMCPYMYPGLTIVSLYVI